MRSLADHYARRRTAHPEDRLLIVFDIDGTILDMRYMVCHVLQGYDHAHGTSWFSGLQASDIDVHENEVEHFLAARGIPAGVRDEVMAWYHARRWAPESVLVAHRPYRGVLEVIRWFQIQPSTSVALNTGRPETLRDATLRSLNALGREYKVRFSDDLLHMNPHGWETDVAATKVAGLRHFQQEGYRVVAAVDNEPEIIEALAAADDTGEVLFLHADTLYQSRRAQTPRTVEGRSYDLTSLVTEQTLPRHIQLVWHGVNDEANLRQFLASSVHWGEMDVRRRPDGQLVLRHDGFDVQPAMPGERLLTLERTLAQLRDAGRGMKLDLKDAAVVADVLALVAQLELSDDDLWFNGRLDLLGEKGLRTIADAHPSATLQCPIDFFGPLITAMPDDARRVLARLREWGVGRFSVSWTHPQARLLSEQLEDWGYEVNVYAVPDLEQFLRAVLMLPRSITADFNFPEWHYYGRGAGYNRHYHSYQLETVAPPHTDVA